MRTLSCRFRTFLSVSLIITCLFISPLQGFSASKGQFNALSSYTAGEHSEFNILKPSRLVMQVIDNRVYKWYEYDSTGSKEFQIAMIEPHRKILTAAEASTLLESSRQWESQISQLTGLGDDRTPVTLNDVLNYPYNTIGYLTIDFPNDYMRGTGFMINPYTVLTNAHNIYIRNFGGWFKTISFSPALYKQQGSSLMKPYPTVNSHMAETNDQYLAFESSGDRNSSINHDYAALFFTEKINTFSTFMPLEFNGYPAEVTLIGYPGLVRGVETMGMWRSEGPVIGRDEYCLYYRAFTSGGNSGGPVLSYNQQAGSFRVVAIHSFTTEGSTIYSGGPYFNEKNRQSIEKWLRWTPEMTAASTLKTEQIDQPALMRGDVNGDGFVNVLDAIMITRHVLQLELLTGDTLARADVNMDGTINVSDVNLIVQYTLGLIESLWSDN